MCDNQTRNTQIMVAIGFDKNFWDKNLGETDLSRCHLLAPTLDIKVIIENTVIQK